MDDPFIAFSGSTRFIGVNTRDNDQFVRNFVGDFCQTADIFADGIFVIRGTGTYDHKEFIGFPSEYSGNFFIPLCFDSCRVGAERILLTDICWRRQSFFKIETHDNLLFLLSAGTPTV